MERAVTAIIEVPRVRKRESERVRSLGGEEKEKKEEEEGGDRKNESIAFVVFFCLFVFLSFVYVVLFCSSLGVAKRRAQLIGRCSLSLSLSLLCSLSS